KLGLQLKCDLTNVTDLSPNGQDFRWYVQSKCSNCGQDSVDFIYVCAAERVPLKDSRGDTNLAIRCKFCDRIGRVAFHLMLTSRKENSKAFLSEWFTLLCVVLRSSYTFSTSLDVLTETYSRYTADDSGSFKTIAVFECRGVELIAFSPRVGWSAVGTETNTLFGDISLSDENWCDYDEKGNCEVSIFNVESRFIKIR
ncbi:Ribosomal RNA assembly protein, partial [Fasciolopsis buskii]